MSFVATTSGLTGEDVRDLMVAAVEYRFGWVNRLPRIIGWLTDNGSCYLARETGRFARDVGLAPRTTSLESPQSNGMAEAFVRTLKRDYVRVSSIPDAERVAPASRLAGSLQRRPPPQGARLPFTPRVHRCPLNPVTLSCRSGATTIASTRHLPDGSDVVPGLAYWHHDQHRERRSKKTLA